MRLVQVGAKPAICPLAIAQGKQSPGRPAFTADFEPSTGAGASRRQRNTPRRWALDERLFRPRLVWLAEIQSPVDLPVKVPNAKPE